jgi:6-phosphogluconolactonase
MRIEVLADQMAVAAAAAEILVGVARDGGHIALSGGSTPGDAYREAAQALPDWSGATLWFGDDRAVPPEHQYSNFRMVHVALLSRLEQERRPTVQRILGEEGADVAAGDYEARVREHLGNRPQLDLALMGLGPDAHTASLFPSKTEIEETQRFVVAVPEAGMAPQVPRVTMTLPVFNAAARVVFLVAGKDKARAMKRAFGDDPDPAAPAARVRPLDGELLILCDEAAAAQL